MKSAINWTIGVILFIAILPLIPVLAWDFARIFWANVPWWAQIVFIVVGATMVALALRKTIKKLRGEGGGSGRTEVHHYYHY